MHWRSPAISACRTKACWVLLHKVREAISGDPSEFPAYIDLNRILRRGEPTQLCMAALETEGPLDTRQLTQRVMAAKGLNVDDKVLAQSIALRIVQTLRVKALRGGPLDGSERRKGACLWRLERGPALLFGPAVMRRGDQRSALLALWSLEHGKSMGMAACGGKAMPSYRFSLLGANGRVQSSCTREADSDDEACEMAEDLLLVSEFPSIEVWRSGMIYRVTKDDSVSPKFKL